MCWFSWDRLTVPWWFYRKNCFLKESGLINLEVVETLKHEGVTVIRVTMQTLPQTLFETGSIDSDTQKGFGRPTLHNGALLKPLKRWCKLMTMRQEQFKSIPTFCGMTTGCLSTILQGRCELGWTYRGSAYYQLIHQVNKEKQLEWAHAHLQEYFEDVVWLDETTVQLHFSLLPTCNWARLYNSHLVDGNNVR